MLRFQSSSQRGGGALTAKEGRSAQRPAKGPPARGGLAYLPALVRACGLGLWLAAGGGAARGQAPADSGPTLLLDCARGPSAENAVADFMYFVALISPEPVTATIDPKSNHRVRVLSATRRSHGRRFEVICEFEFSGSGCERNIFDYSREIRRREGQLKRDGFLPHLLASLNVEGPGRGTIEIEGAQTNGAPTVAEVRLRFNTHGQGSPVTIALLDVRYRDGVVRPVNEVVARVNTLTFQRRPGPPKMEVSVASVKPKDASDSYWQNLKGSLKGLAVNLLIPPLNVDARGHQAMLDFGLALATGAATFTFPHAANLLPARGGP